MTHAKFTPVTDATFEDIVLKADGPVLVKFEADWCGPCKAMVPVLGEIAQEYADSLKVVTLDIDENGNSPYRYGIRGVPTMLLFNNGEVIAQKVGLTRKADIVAMLDGKLAA